MAEYLSQEEIENTFPTCTGKYWDWLNENYDRMSPIDRYWKTIDVYAVEGYDFPKKWIIRLKKIRPADYLRDLPPELANVDPITVYRGSGWGFNPRTELSWTTDRNTAIWFYWRKKQVADSMRGCGMGKSEEIKALCSSGSPMPTLYTATIEKRKIIAAISGTEHEILQHCGVENVQEVFPSKDEIEAAVEEHRHIVESSNSW